MTTDPKILEIGPSPFIHSAFPATTDFYSTWSGETLSEPAQGRHIVSLTTLPALLRRIKDPAYDVVVVHSSPNAPWSLRALSRTIFRRSALRGSIPLLRSFGSQLLRAGAAAPIAVLDMDDPTVIDQSNIFLLDKSTLFFKRELPVDTWQVFNGTLHWRVPTPRFRADARNRERVAKILPVSLGLPIGVQDRPAAAPLPPEKKTTDVFFAGRVHASSTVRERGINELMGLRAEGYVIDIPEEPLSIDAYLQRCAQAWIVWSPAGYGWQCFRTYEAALCGSVPLATHAPIQQNRPLVEGQHALYYDAEPGGLANAIRAALADRTRLTAIAASARTHVLTCHSPQNIARYLVETTLRQAGSTERSGESARQR